MTEIRKTSSQTTGEVLAARLDAVSEMIEQFDGSPVSKSLIRRAVLRSILHLPPHHEAGAALNLFYQAMDQASQGSNVRKTKAKAPQRSSIQKIWSHARKAIETVSRKTAHLENARGA